MKRYKSVIFLLISLCFLGYSCKDEGSEIYNDSSKIELTPEEYISLSNTPEISESEVQKVVNRFLSKINTDDIVSENVNVKIDSKYYLAKEKGVSTRSASVSAEKAAVPIYQIELSTDNGKGMAYVSGIEGFQKVLAYIPIEDEEEGPFSTGADILLNLSHESILAEYIEFTNKKDSLKMVAISKIQAKIGEKDFNLETVKNRIVVSEENTTRSTPVTDPLNVTTTCGPLCQTAWNQNAPYNSYLTSSAPAGCAVIAIAQILSSLKPSMACYGVTIDWDYLTETQKIYTTADTKKLQMIGYLIKHIYEGTNTSPIYDDNGNITSSSTTSNKSLSYLKTVLSSTGSLSKWSSSTANAVLSTLLTQKPVWARGDRLDSAGKIIGSHAWVIDGFVIAAKTTREIVKNNDLYWHANFGWGGTSNGYYLINTDLSMDWETAMGNYNSNLSVIPYLTK